MQQEGLLKQFDSLKKEKEEIYNKLSEKVYKTKEVERENQSLKQSLESRIKEIEEIRKTLEKYKSKVVNIEKNNINNMNQNKTLEEELRR